MCRHNISTKGSGRLTAAITLLFAIKRDGSNSGLMLS